MTNFDALRREAHRRLADVGVVVLQAEQNHPGLLLHRLRTYPVPRPAAAVVAAVEALTVWQTAQNDNRGRPL